MTLFPDAKTVISFDFLGLSVTWYAVFVLSAAFVCYYLSIRTLKKWGYKTDIFEDFFFYMLPISIIGARIWYVVFEWNNQYAANPISALYIWNGGIAIHGGVIAAFLFGLWYFKGKGVNGLRICDAIMPNLLIAQAIGRWGNFVNQEAYGEIVSESFYDGFPSFIKEQMFIGGQYRQPTFLFEGIGNLIGFVLIVFVYRKYGRRKRGDMAYAYIAWYGLVRLIVEGMRTDSLMLGGLRVAQLISIIGIVIGVLGILGVWDRLFSNYWLFHKEKPVVLFDLDGTLLDTKELIFESFRYVFKNHKPEYTLSEQELNSFLEPTLKQTMERYFDPSLTEELIEEYRRHNHEYHDAYVKPFAGAKETLEYLKEHGYPLGIVSNKKKETIQHGLVSCGLDPYFDVIVDCDDVDQPKPDPQGLLKACELLYHGHDDMIYIGDSVSDIEACKNMAGFSIAACFDPDREEALKEAKPCRCIHQLQDVIDIVKEDAEWSDNTIY